MAQHDSAYKNLFSHPQVVRDLLLGFVHEPWVREIDFSTLEKANGSYVSDDLRHREDDIVWRVRRHGSWFYIYLLIEFQSTDDPWMAVRILTYVGLLYQDLIKRREIVPPQRLPPVFPVVIYNGTPRWRSRRDIADLIEPPPPGLRRYLPRQRYFLLDEGHETILAQDNTVSDIIALETGPSPEALATVVARLTARLQTPENRELRRALTVWIHRVVLQRLVPSTTIPPVHDLKEIESMLAERVVEWTKTWKEQGIEEGHREGLKAGREEGRAEGWKEGQKEGRKEGRRDGERAVLERQLTRRFGPMPESLQARLHDATTKQLERWADRVLDAVKIEDVFRD